MNRYGRRQPKGRSAFARVLKTHVDVIPHCFVPFSVSAPKIAKVRGAFQHSFTKMSGGEANLHVLGGVPRA